MARGRRPTDAAASPRDCVPIIFAHLRRMAPTGPDGFEGLVADALSEVSGQVFRLVKPGPQGGADAVSERIGNGCVIAMEAKRFQEGTALRLDELKRKVAEVHEAYPAVETWVLAASREVSGDDVTALEGYAAAFGLAVLVLDTRPLPGGLPGLSVLCAAAPLAVKRHFPASAALERSLSALRDAPAYAVAVETLRARLRSADVGYEATRTTLARWMRAAMAELGEAKSRLCSHADLLAPSTKAIITRGTADGFLDTAIADPASVHTLLGAEGVGKTWAMLAWWHLRAGRDGEGLPLTVYLPAQRVGQAPVEDAITDCVAEALFRRTMLRDCAFWTRRLRRWRTGGGLRVLLIIDGLNQNWLVEDWKDLLQPLVSGEWKGRVTVVLTCRPDHWDHLHKLCDLWPEPRQTELLPFDEVELDSMLGMVGRRREDYDGRLLALMRVPRLFSLAIALQGRIDATAELTPEVLALEDWQDRLRVHGSRLKLDAGQFRSFIGRLGRRFRDALGDQDGQGRAEDLSRAELVRELGGLRGHGGRELAGTVSELIDGRWLPSSGPDGQVRLDKEATPIALGISLLEVLRSKRTATEIADAIADFTDPLRGADLGVAALRAAATAALVEKGTARVIRHALLTQWLTSQNFGNTDYQAFWRLVGLDPHLCVDIAQELWTAGRAGIGFAEDEVLTKAFAAASGRHHVAEVVESTTLQWLSAVWPESVEWMHQDKDFPRISADALDDLAASLARLRAMGGLDEALTPVLAALHPERDAVGCRRLCAAAVAVASYRPRTGVVPALAAWCIAGSLMQVRPLAELVAWALRINPDDPREAEAAILRLASSLACSGSEALRLAAAELLRALATRSAGELAERFELAIQPSAVAPAVRQAALAETQVSIQDLLRLGPEAIAPGSSIDAPEQAAIIQLCRTQPIDTLVDHLARNPFAGIGATLARWAPQEFRSLLRRAAQTAASASERPPWLERLLRRMPDVLAFTDEETRTALATAWHNGGGSQADVPHIVDLTCTALMLYGREATDQVRLLAGAEPVGLAEGARRILQPVPVGEVERLAGHMGATAEPKHLRFWLQHLVWAGIEGELPVDSFLLDLSAHPDVGVRALAMRVIGTLGPGAAAAEFARRGWTWHEGVGREEAASGSFLLLNAKRASPTTGPELLDRADPQIAGYALHHDVSEVDRFEALLEREVDHLLDHAAQHSSSRRWCLVEEELDLFVAQRPDAAERLIAPFLAAGHGRFSAVFMGFPVVGLCRGLLRHRPETGARLWRSLIEEQHKGFSRDELPLLPFQVARSAITDPLREEALAAADDDAELAAIAQAATEREEDSWLVDLVGRDLAVDGVAAVYPARALTLAGFAHATPQVRRLWSGTLSRAPARGWLTQVHTAAQAAFAAHVAALHWLEALVAARTRQDVAAAHFLFTACADGRAARVARRMVEATKDELLDERAQAWNLVQAAGRDGVARLRGERGKLFCATPVAPTLSPWR